MFLYKFLKEQVQDIALLMALLKLHIMLLGRIPGFLQCMDFMEIHPGIFFHGVYHGDSLKRLAQIHLYALVVDRRGSQYLLRHVTVQIFCQIHHAVVICVRLVQLHQRKLRVVPGIQTLISEHAADLVNALQASYNQSL